MYENGTIPLFDGISVYKIAWFSKSRKQMEFKGHSIHILLLLDPQYTVSQVRQDILATVCIGLHPT